MASSIIIYYCHELFSNLHLLSTFRKANGYGTGQNRFSVKIWLPFSFPHESPELFFFVPAPDSPTVGNWTHWRNLKYQQSSQFSLYLKQWKVESSTLVGLLQVINVSFLEHSPVRATPKPAFRPIADDIILKQLGTLNDLLRDKQIVKSVGFQKQEFTANTKTERFSFHYTEDDGLTLQETGSDDKTHIRTVTYKEGLNSSNWKCVIVLNRLCNNEVRLHFKSFKQDRSYKTKKPILDFTDIIHALIRRNPN